LQENRAIISENIVDPPIEIHPVDSNSNMPLDTIIPSKEICKIYVHNYSQPQESDLVVSVDEVKKKFKELLREKREIDCQIINEGMIEYNKQCLQKRRRKSYFRNANCVLSSFNFHQISTINKFKSVSDQQNIFFLKK
jgi:hypothetical protein